MLGLFAVAGSIYLDNTRSDWTMQGWVAFEVFQRPMLVAGVSWIIFACSTGYGGIASTIVLFH